MHTYLNSLLPGQPFFWRILFFATSVRTRTLDYRTKRRGKKRRQFYKHRVLFYTSSACSFKQVYSIYSKRSTSGSKSFTRNSRGGRVKTLRIYLVEKKNTHVGRKGKKRRGRPKKGKIYTRLYVKTVTGWHWSQGSPQERYPPQLRQKQQHVGGPLSVQKCQRVFQGGLQWTIHIAGGAYNWNWRVHHCRHQLSFPFIFYRSRKERRRRNRRSEVLLSLFLSFDLQSYNRF